MRAVVALTAVLRAEETYYPPEVECIPVPATIACRNTCAETRRAEKRWETCDDLKCFDKCMDISDEKRCQEARFDVCTSTLALFLRMGKACDHTCVEVKTGAVRMTR